MNEVVIYKEQYNEETNDPNERREAAKLGPRSPDGAMNDDGKPIRIARTGQVVNGTRYRLSGWGAKMDREPQAKLDGDAELWAIRFLRKAYTFGFKDELRGALVARLKTTKLAAVEKECKEAMVKGNMGPLQAMRFVLLTEVPRTEDRVKPSSLPQQNPVGGVELYDTD